MGEMMASELPKTIEELLCLSFYGLDMSTIHLKWAYKKNRCKYYKYCTNTN